MRHLYRSTLLVLLVLLPAVPVRAQTMETVGSRALGMGGAFVALADDSSATWWNPAGLAAGPFLDLAVGGATTDIGDGAGRRARSTWFALGTPPFGVSYYRLRINEMGAGGSTGQGVTIREEEATALGITLVQTIVSGVHVGTTLKYLRGSNEQMAARQGFDLDAGILAVVGPVRAGAVVRNVREADLGAVSLSRQVRVGAAFSGAEAGLAPWTVSVDADAGAYRTAFGDRRVVAMGGEGWLFERRVGLRAGARFNTVGAEERAMTVGASFALRTALYVDAHLVRGGGRDEQGWGIAARVSF